MTTAIIIMAESVIAVLVVVFLIRGHHKFMKDHPNGDSSMFNP